MQQAYRLEAADVVLQKTPFTFDVSVWEFFWPLLTGARLVLAAPGAHRNPQELIELILQHQITTLHFVPSLLGSFIGSARVERCTTLRRLLCIGEALTAAQVQAAQSTLSQITLHNLYGPTETAVHVTAWCCPTDFDSSSVPIGHPIANTHIYLLDAHGELVPRGSVGELYIGGAGVARGYLHQPKLTAERFLSDPFSSEPGARLYRTGDLARYLPDGNLEFVGRNDEQLKIRGFRIEPGEIQVRLSEHPRVREAQVLAREDTPGDKRLIAYVLLQEDAGPEDRADLAASLREHVAARLPEYMVPAAYVVVEAWPLTPNGKLDRTRLPAPDEQALVHQPYEAPRGEIECTLAQLWSELLGVERISRHDNFFELGGHSLLAMRLLGRISQELGISVQLSRIFENAQLAAYAKTLLIATANQVFDPTEFRDFVRAELRQ
jgi:acyl-coenzyme A synthetase/AMP-(fatty) acid ligase/acyl carrier protein